MWNSEGKRQVRMPKGMNARGNNVAEKKKKTEYCLRYLRRHQHHGLTASSVDTSREKPDHVATH